MNERLEQLRKMLQESSVDNETKDLLEELEANDAPQVVKDGEPEEGVGTSEEADFGVDSEEYDDVDSEEADELQETEELGTNDAAEVVKDGEPEEGVGTTSEEDLDVDSEEYDDVDSEAAEDLQEAEELEANDAPQVVKDGEPEEGLGTTSEEDVDIDSEDYDDVDSEEAESLQEGEKAKKIAKGVAKAIGGAALGAAIGAAANTAASASGTAAEVAKDKNALSAAKEDTINKVKDGKRYISRNDVNKLNDLEGKLSASKEALKNSVKDNVAKGSIAGAAAGLAAGTTKAVVDAKKEHDANKVKTEVDETKDKLKELKKKEKEEKKEQRIKERAEKKKKELEELEKDINESVDSVNEDTLEIEPAVVDALDSGNADGVAPIVTDVQIEPSEEDVDINIDAVTESVDSIFADIFSTLHEEELGANDTPQVVKDGEPEEGVGTTSEEDLDVDSEKYDDAAPVTESDFTDMELMEMLEESKYEASIENVKLLRENEKIFNEFLGMGWRAAGKRLAKNQEKAKRAELAGDTFKAEKFQNKANVQLKHFENGSAKRKEKMADGLASVANKIKENETKSQKAIKLVNKSSKDIASALEDTHKAKNSGQDNKDTDEVKKPEPVAESEFTNMESIKMLKESKMECAIEVLKELIDVHSDGNTLIITKKGELDKTGAPKIKVKISKKQYDILEPKFHEEEVAPVVTESEEVDVYDVNKAIVQNDLGASENGNNTAEKAKEYAADNCTKDDCCKDVEYSSLEEAVALGASYFLDDEARITKLTEQVALTMASENNDALFNEMVRSQAIVNRCYNALLERYINEASNRVSSLLEELEANEAPQVVKDGEPEEATGDYNEEDLDVNSEKYDDVDSEAADDLQESEELGANEAPEVVKDGVPAEGVGTSSEEDFGVDTEDYDDIDSEEALDLQEANFSRETVMSVLEESNYYQASESNVTAILESIRLGYADEIPSEIVTGLMESEEAQYKKALKKKMKLENKKNELLSKEKMITDAVKRDLYHNKIVKKVADIEAKIKVLDNEITQKAGIAEVGNDHTEDPAK